MSKIDVQGLTNIIVKLEDRLGEAYQAVGSLADELGLFEDERFQKILDLLSGGKEESAHV